MADWGWRLGVALLAFVIPVTGAERFPPPEFEPGTYTMPGITAPPARGHLWEWLDVGLLVLALSLAAYFMLVKRSRRHVLWLMLGSLAWFGFVRQGCVCPIGAIQDVTLALFDRTYAVPLSVVAFFLLPLGFTLFFGRGFCAGVCPLGAAQDAVHWKSIKLKPWLEHALGIVPYFYLGAAVLFAATGSAFIICEWDPFVSFFRLGGPWRMLALGAGFLAIGLFIGRPYCRFLCPYGALLSLFSRASRWNVTLTEGDCIKCQLCDVACPFGSIAEPSETAPPAPVRTPGRMAASAAAMLLLIAVGGWIGGQLAVPFSKMHRTVQLAERVAAEDAGTFSEPDNASKAFRQTGRPAKELHATALAKRQEFKRGGWIFGAFCGLVVGIKLLALAWGTRRTIYEPDRATCFGCARCYSYCPKELVRVKRVEKTATPAESSKA